MSYARTKSVNARSRAVYAHLNLYNKPMQVFNVDETSVNVTQHRGKVVMEVKNRGVHRVIWLPRKEKPY